MTPPGPVVGGGAAPPRVTEAERLERRDGEMSNALKRLMGSRELTDLSDFAQGAAWQDADSAIGYVDHNPDWASLDAVNRVELAGSIHGALIAHHALRNETFEDERWTQRVAATITEASQHGRSRFDPAVPRLTDAQRDNVGAALAIFRHHSNEGMKAVLTSAALEACTDNDTEPKNRWRHASKFIVAASVPVSALIGLPPIYGIAMGAGVGAGADLLQHYRIDAAHAEEVAQAKQAGLGVIDTERLKGSLRELRDKSTPDLTRQASILAGGVEKAVRSRRSVARAVGEQLPKDFQPITLSEAPDAEARPFDRRRLFVYTSLGAAAFLAGAAVHSIYDENQERQREETPVTTPATTPEQGESENCELAGAESGETIVVNGIEILCD